MTRGVQRRAEYEATGMLRCTRCDEMKDADQFRDTKQGVANKSSRCTPCLTEIQYEYRMGYRTPKAKVVKPAPRVFRVGESVEWNDLRHGRIKGTITGLTDVFVHVSNDELGIKRSLTKAMVAA